LTEYYVQNSHSEIIIVIRQTIDRVWGNDAGSFLRWDYMGHTGVDWGGGGVGLNITLGCEGTRRQGLHFIR